MLDFVWPALALMLLTGLVSGSYPAFYLSGFRSVAIVKGSLKTSPRQLWARKGLVVFQFAVSIILIISVLIVRGQTGFI